MKFSRRILLTFIVAGLLFAAHQSVFAKDDWIQVKSKNFFLIGNASEKDIKKVATRLEQFRETFRQVFGGLTLNSSIPTNVVVFKSDSSFKNFKPKRADGKIDTFVAGYFQPGEDVNYITLSTEGEDAQTFSLIFHEYVHFIINTNFGKSDIPAWFNEGLAEYYSTFAIEDDIRVKLGLPLAHHILRLRETKLMPLDTLFKISNRQLLETGDHSRSIVYSESWALLHYLIQGGKTEGLGKFLNALISDVPPEKAFRDAFQLTYQQMESQLKKYVSKSSYFHQQLTFKNKLLFEADMQVSPLAAAESNAYLGDLLYHTNRVDDAEPFLLTALKLDPNSSMANTTLGMVRMKQRKFDEAKLNLEKAIAGDPKNHIAFFRYAYLLNRESQDEFGYARSFEKGVAAKMREALKKAIALNPAFTESYELLAYVNVVNDEELDDAAKMMRTALKYQPGNQRYALRLAEILSRQNKLDEANVVAEKISRTADEPDVKSRAEGLLSYIAQKREYDKRSAANQNLFGSQGSGVGSGPPGLIRSGETGRKPTEAELEKRSAEALLRSVNESLRKSADGEQRLVARVQKIDCKSRPIVFTIKSGTDTFTVTSKDFDTLTLNSFAPMANNAEVGCDADLSVFDAVVTYRASTASKGSLRGEIKAIEFVPENFRLMTAEEMSSPPAKQPNNSDQPDNNERRTAMVQAIKEALQKPAAGQKREMGYLDRIECTKKEMFFHFRTNTQTLRLLNSSPQSLRINVFTPDLTNLLFGCALKPVEYPVVFIYADKPDAKAKSAGEIVSLEFVPKSFVLDR